MRLLFRLLLIMLLVSPICARQLPFTAKEICLMLRTGYSSDALMRELAVRHFADTCDEATKKLLTQSGASPALVQALSAGAYSIPPEETARAREALAAESKRRTAAM